MCLKFVLLLSGAIALSFSVAPMSTLAQSDAFPGDASANPGVNFKLNQKQRGAIQQFSKFAFDQFEDLLTGGLESGKVTPPQPSPQTEQMLRDFASDLRPDQEQIAELRNLLETARQQLDQQFEQK
ncbi:hypothetical protein K9N68_27810 [Kovacikia minuta CCNUW1]|uniref:hypothetical protein n=1 Tax=Kovacikia minuta TaxID=2931930 RepID=UPI001CC9774E|nr:hypothetical protein [Kovacikia minuta]UBF25371.1 hypothetical protein K9N68_27810 [Kovacikia minuta CCNUW1]